MKQTQNLWLLNYLKTHKYITALQALELSGIMRLGARIYDIKKTNNIESEFINVYNRWGEVCRVKRYWLEK